MGGVTNVLVPFPSVLDPCQDPLRRKKKERKKSLAYIIHGLFSDRTNSTSVTD